MHHYNKNLHTHDPVILSTSCNSKWEHELLINTKNRKINYLMIYSWTKTWASTCPIHLILRTQRNRQQHQTAHYTSYHSAGDRLSLPHRFGSLWKIKQECEEQTLTNIVKSFPISEFHFHSASHRVIIIEDAQKRRWGAHRSFLWYVSPVLRLFINLSPKCTIIKI